MYYVYGHYTKDTDELFYVGIGYDDRAWSGGGRTTYWKNTVAKHGGRIVKFFKEGLTKEEAERLEIALIQEYGRKLYDEGGVLVNIAKGGKVNTGYTLTEEHKRKLSDSKKRLWDKRGRKVHKKMTPEERVESYRRRGDKMRLVWQREGYRDVVGDKIRDSQTSEQRRINTLRGWKTRRDDKTL